MELKDYLRILRRRLHILLGAVAVILACHFIAAALEQEIFAARATVLLRIQSYLNEYALLRGGPYKTQWMVSMSTHEEKIKSSNVALHAAMLVKAGEISRTDELPDAPRALAMMLDSGYITKIAPAQSKFLTERGRAELEPLRELIQSSTSVTRPREDVFIVEVAATATTAKNAMLYVNAIAQAAEYTSRGDAQQDILSAMSGIRRDIVNAILTEEILTPDIEGEINILLSRTPGRAETTRDAIYSLKESLDYSSNQAEGVVDLILRSKSRELMRKNEEMGYVDYSDKINQVMSEISQIDREISHSHGELEKIDERLTSLIRKQTYGEIHRAGAPEPTGRPERINSIQDQILEARLRLEDLEKHYTLDHPDVVEARGRIATLEKMLDKEIENRYSMDARDLVESRGLVRVDVARLEREKEKKKAELARLQDFGRDYSQLATRLADLKKQTDRFEQDMYTLRGLIGFETGYIRVEELASDESVSALPKKTTKATLFVVVIALLIGSALAYLTEYIDTSIVTDHDVRRHLNLPVLAIVPMSKESTLTIHAPPRSPLGEIFSTAATLIRKASLEEPRKKSILICSSTPKEGKTTIAINLATALARKRLKVALIDSDLRMPAVHKMLSLDNSFGLTSILEGKLPAIRDPEDIQRPDEARRLKIADCLRETSVPNLRVLPCGPSSHDPVGLIESGTMGEAIKALEDEFDFLIFDSPPICSASDAVLLSSMIDACIFVVGSGQVDQRQASWAKHLLAKVEANVIGVILNKSQVGRGTEYYYYYYYQDRVKERV